MADTWEYKVRDQSGRIVSGTLVADNEQLLLSRLREMGYTPVKVSQQGTGAKREIKLFSRVKVKDLSLFSRQFATMVNSGLPILKALTILEQQTESKLLGKTITDVRLDIERGSSLSAAMGKHPKVFNNLYVAMVRSGEAAGVLEQVLDRLASNLEREVSLRHRIKSAMTYPIVVLGFVSLILAAMLLFIVPQFQGIYKSLNGTLPVPTQILLKVSELFRHDFIIVVLVTGATVYLLRRWKKTDKGRETFDRLKLRLPVFGPLFQ